MPFTYEEYMKFPLKVKQKIIKKLEKIQEQKNKALEDLKS